MLNIHCDKMVAHINYATYKYSDTVRYANDIHLSAISENTTLVQ